MKAGERIVRVFADMRRKGCHGARIGRFQFCECVHITVSRVTFALLTGEWFEDPQRLGLPSQNKVADWPPAKLLDFFR